jgi:hypothetical protein
MARPRHHDQIIAGEQLSARNHDQDQAEAKGQSRQNSDHPIGQGASACGRRRGKYGAQRDKCSGQDGQCKHPERIQL